MVNTIEVVTFNHEVLPVIGKPLTVDEKKIGEIVEYRVDGTAIILTFKLNKKGMEFFKDNPLKLNGENWDDT